MDTDKFIECNKLNKVATDSQKIGEFLEWCSSKEMFLATYDLNYPDFNSIIPCTESIEQLLARYFEIDMVKVEKERQEILRNLQ